MICRFMKRIVLAAFLFVTLVLSAAEPAPTLRRNTVDEVIAAMTPEEKVLMVIGNKTTTGAGISAKALLGIAQGSV